MTNKSRSARRQVQTPGVTTTTDETTATSPTALAQGASTDDATETQTQAGAVGHPDAASVGNSGAGETSGPETVTITKEALDALIAQAAAGQAANRPAVVRQAELPDQSQVDSSKIKQSQLTKQGWVVPDNLGSNPNGQKL